MEIGSIYAQTLACLERKTESERERFREMTVL